MKNQVLDYILTHMTEISSQTIYEVAQALFVSTATISRTAKHLGYRGFQELKIRNRPIGAEREHRKR